MDFLGLRTLTVIQDAIRLVEKSTGVKLVTEELNYNDKAVLDYIGTGKTDGIFQIESAGMKSFMKELRPQSLEDIIAGISLYRPGPMDFIPQYIKGKNHPELITYECPQLEPILHRPTAASYTRNRLCRSCVTLPDIHLGEATLYVVP